MSSPYEAPAEGGPIENDKLYSLATDVCNGMARSLSAFRTYQPGHAMVTDFQNKLLERIRQMIEGVGGAFQLEVRPRAFAMGEKEVYKDGSDPLCRRLYIEGIEFIRFRDGLELEELNLFMDIWYRVRFNRIPPDHSFQTLFWEANLGGIELGFKESYFETASENDDASGEEAAKRRQQSRDEQVGAVVKLLSSAEVAGKGLEDKAPPKASLIPVLKSESIADLSEKELEELAQARRAPPSVLAESDRRAFLLELEAALRESPRRALADLWHASAFAAESEREAVLGAARKVIALLVRENEHLPLAAALKEIGNAVRANPARMPEFKGWIAAFLEPELTQTVAAQLDDEARAAAALELLKLIPRTEAGALIGMLAILKTHEGRTRLVELLVARQVTGDQLVGRVHALDPALLPYLTTLKQRLPPDESRWYVGALINSPQASTRREGVAALRPGDIPMLRARLLAMLDDADAGVRLALYRLFANAGEIAVTPKLVSRLTLEHPDQTEREQLVRALARLNGKGAADAVCHEFQNASTVEYKIVCAESLGLMREKVALAPLKTQAGKWFAPKRLKAACKEAIAMIQSARGGGKGEVAS